MVTARWGQMGRRAALALGWAALAFYVLALCTRAIHTPDAYFHLAVGDEILTERRVPTTAHWVAGGERRPFVDAEWGFQAALAAVWRRWGALGALWLRGALAVLATLAVAAAARSLGAGGALFAAAGFVFLSSPRWLLAPELVSILLFALVVLLAERGRRLGRWRWSLVALSLLWANVHGFFLLAPLVLAAYGAAEAWRGEGRCGLAIAALAALATLCNPYGVRGALYPLGVLADRGGRALLAERIVELRSPLATPWAAMGWQQRATLGLALLLALAAIAALRRPRRPERSFVFGLGALLALAYVRNVGLAAVPAGLALAVLGQALPARLRRGLGRPALAVGVPLVLAVVLGLRAEAVLSGSVDAASIDPIGLGARFAPMIEHRRALAFYRNEGLPSPLWCGFGSGHAVIWEGRGALRPWLCGHTDLYPRERLAAYGRALRGEPGAFDALLSRWPADAWLVDHQRLGGSGLLARLLDDRSWTLVYLDDRDAIFLRAAGRRAALAARLALDRGRLRARALPPPRAQPVPGWVAALRRAGIVRTPRPLPRARVALARWWLEAGEPETALRLAREAVAFAPDWAPAQWVLGLAELRLGRLEPAKAALRRARHRAPDTPGILGALGLVHLRLGETGRAIELLERALRLAPDEAAVRENLRVAYRRAGHAEAARRLGGPRGGQREEAVRRFEAAVAAAEAGDRERAQRLYREALTLDPTLFEAWFNLGNLLYRARRSAEALACYDRALRLRPDDPETLYNRAAALWTLGRREQARSALERVLAVAPRHAQARALLERLEGEGGRTR